MLRKINRDRKFVAVVVAVFRRKSGWSGIFEIDERVIIDGARRLKAPGERAFEVRSFSEAVRPQGARLGEGARLVAFSLAYFARR